MSKPDVVVGGQGSGFRRPSHLKWLMWFSSSPIRRLLTAWNFCSSSTVTVPVPSGLDTGTEDRSHERAWLVDASSPDRPGPRLGPDSRPLPVDRKLLVCVNLQAQKQKNQRAAFILQGA